MFSFSSSKLVDRPFDWAYQLKDLGYSGWEIVNEGRQRLTAESMVQAREIVETTDLVITIHLPYSDLNLASVNQPIWEETVRQMKSCLDLASEFSRLAVLHPGHFSPLGMQMPDAAWSQSILGIQQVCDHAAGLDMRVAVENMVNMPAILGRRPEEVMGIIETVNRENVGFVFDVGPATPHGNVKDFLKFSRRIIHFHVHDNRGERDEHLPVGNGTVPWKKVAQALQGYEGRIVTESRSLEEGQRSVVRLKRLMGI